MTTAPTAATSPRTAPDGGRTDTTPAVALAIDFLPGSLGYDGTSFTPDAAVAAQILWLDAFTANVDRSWRNPNRLVWHGRLWAIDHGAALYFHHRWSSSERFAHQLFTYTRGWRTVVRGCRRVDGAARAVRIRGAARWHVDADRLHALHDEADISSLQAALDAVQAACAGEDRAGPSGEGPPGPRFRRLASPRSTVLQAGPIHTGLTDDPEGQLDHLFARLVA